MARGVDVLLRKMDEGVAELRRLYSRDLDAKVLSDEILYTVMRIVSDGQAALDRTATALDHKYGKAADRSPYYPLTSAPTIFRKVMSRHFPTVPLPVANAIERHQPYQSGKVELGYLPDLARVEKHQDFTPKVRFVSRRAIYKSAHGGEMRIDLDAFDAGVFGGGRMVMDGVPVHPKTLVPMGEGLTRVDARYVGWNFVRPPVPVFSTLESLNKLIREAVIDIHGVADL